MFLIILIGCMALGLLIHELGHVAAFAYYGYKIQTLIIGLPIKPLIKIRLKMIANELYLSPYLWSGATISIVQQKPVASKWLFINLAGPASNILVLVLIYLFRGPSEFISASTFLTSGQSQPGIWAVLIVFNFAFGFGELIPYLAKDGTEILNVITGKYTRELKAIKN